nr:class I SAM-dependent methyltransferase [uncultured Rhodoferax sp.]
MTTEVPGTLGYGANAISLANQYESITFVDVYGDLIHFIPRSRVTALDIGAGSGRDAAALARLGHKVVAVEPTGELRREGQRRHGGLTIDWVDDHLPALKLLRKAKCRFDLVFVTAVWMHLDFSEREEAMESVAELVADGGHVFFSLRHGPIPKGRRMFDVSSNETACLAAKHGLHCHHRSEREDMLGRDDVKWSFLVMRPIARGR